jgi:hypothetical protein
MINISRNVGDSEDQRGTHDPAIRDQPPHQTPARGLTPVLQGLGCCTQRPRPKIGMISVISATSDASRAT